MAPMAGRNPNARGRDMVISMAVLVIPIVLIAWFFTIDPKPEVEPVNVAPVLARAESESPYPVLRATNLPESWVPARVAWARDGDRWITDKPADGNSWQLGYLAPNQIYIGLQQRDRSTTAFVSSITRDGKRLGSEVVTTGGRDWEKWASADHRTRSLVWRDGEMVAVVTGDTGFDQLSDFAATLTDR